MLSSSNVPSFGCNMTGFVKTTSVEGNVTVSALLSTNMTAHIIRAADATLSPISTDPMDLTNELLIKEQALATAKTSLIAVSLALAFILLSGLGVYGYGCYKRSKASRQLKTSTGGGDGVSNYSGQTAIAPDSTWFPDRTTKMDENGIEMV